VLFVGLGSGLLETQSLLITSRTPKEANSRSLIAAFTWLGLALRNGGWFVLLQKVAHRRLARAENLPPRPYDFLE